MPQPRLPHHRVVRRLGAGGMGEVWLARDLRLERDVALKVLSPELAGDERSRERLVREARSAAGLSHPGIVTIHAVEEDAGVPVIVMEHVEGTALSRLIPPEGLPLPRVLDLGAQLARAVAAAHEAGITHRDLKPGNVIVDAEGRVRVLDFGLARRVGPQADDDTPPSERPTRAALTRPREVVGTIAYMSPEQAEGRAVDARTDLFSLGVVLHEMATGRVPFEGESDISVLSAILRDTPPPVTVLNPTLPRELARIVSRCLEKDVERRYQCARDLALDLDELGRAAGDGVLPEREPTAHPRRSRWWGVVLAAVAVGWLMLGIGIGLRLRRPATPALAGGAAKPPPRVAAITQLTIGPELELHPSLSADGRTLIHAARSRGQWDVVRRRVGGRRSIVLTPDSPEDDTQPALSPDGELVAFRSERDGGGLFVMGATGESVRRLTDFGANPAWFPDGRRIVFASEAITLPHARQSRSSLWTVPADGTGRAELLSPDDLDAVQPAVSPDGRRIAWWGLGGGTGNRDLWTSAADGTDPVRITTDPAVDWSPTWSADGQRLIFCSNRGGAMGLWSVGIDAATGGVTEAPVALTTGAPSAALHPSAAADGGSVAAAYRLSRSNVEWIEFKPGGPKVVGEARPITAGSVAFGRPEPSPDGRLVAFASTEGQEDLFVAATDGSERRQLTDDRHADRIPRWSPTDDRIAFFSNRGGSYDIWIVRADGSNLRQLTDTPGQATIEPIWSPDGRRLAYVDTVQRSLVVLDATEGTDGEVERFRWTAEDGAVFLPHSWSDDDRLAGTVGSSDGRKVGLGIYDLKTGEHGLVRRGGDLPVWLDAKRLLFLERGVVRCVRLRDGETETVLALEPPSSVAHFALGAGGKSLLFTRLMEDADLWLFELSD